MSGLRICEVYEVINHSFGDMGLEEQIAEGVNDWRAECSDGAVFFGCTEAEARGQAERWCGLNGSSGLIDGQGA